MTCHVQEKEHSTFGVETDQQAILPVDLVKFEHLVDNEHFVVYCYLHIIKQYKYRYKYIVSFNIKSITYNITPIIQIFMKYNVITQYDVDFIQVIDAKDIDTYLH